MMVKSDITTLTQRPYLIRLCYLMIQNMFLLPNTSPYAQLTDLSCYTLTIPVPYVRQQASLSYMFLSLQMTGAYVRH
jgi:hypothetical protein